MIHKIDTFPGRKIVLDGKNYRYFGGTSYLGVQADLDFQELLVNNIRKYGTNYGASRNSNIRLSIFEIAEAHLTTLARSEACTALSSGFLAGQLLCNFFTSRQRKLFYAPNTHSALYQAQIKPYATFSALNSAVREYVASSKKQPPVVLMDAIDFSGTNYPHFEGLKTLPLSEIILVVDDSHGFGLVGENGGGVYAMLAQLQPKELLVCTSLGKSMGIQAGALFGTSDRIKEIMGTEFFGGASPAAPAAMATLVEAEAIYKTKRELLQNNIGLLLSQVADHSPFSFMERHPAFSFPNNELTAYLRSKNILVTSFRYPNESASAMNRIVLSAAHTQKDIDYLAEVLNNY